MNLIWRFLWVVLFSRFAPKVSLLDTSSISFRVLPTDVDLLFHLNNGRYLSLMDLARIDLIIRSGAFSLLRKKKIYPVIASEMIRFKKSLPLFQRFTITTQIAGWDDKFFYLIQYFKQGNHLHALGIVKARFLQSKGSAVSPAKILDIIGEEKNSPPLPAWVYDWQKADNQFYIESDSKRLL